MTTEYDQQDIERNNHSQWILCGTLNPRSMRLKFHPDGKNAVVTEFQGRSELQGYDNILHGGVISSLLDASMTHWLFHQGIQAVTGDLHVRFVHPVPWNSLLTIRAWQVAVSPRLYHLKAEVALDGCIMAWAEAEFLRRPGAE